MHLGAPWVDQYSWGDMAEWADMGTDLPESPSTLQMQITIELIDEFYGQRGPPGSLDEERVR